MNNSQYERFNTVRFTPPSGVLALGFLLLATLLAGCPQPLDSTASSIIQTETLTTYDLALQLNLEILESSSTGVTLQRGLNVVTIYPDPDAQVYVNGKMLSDTGSIIAVGDLLHFSSRLAEQIRLALPKRPAGTDVITDRRKPTQKIKPPRRKRGKLGRVVIDPGHGGRDPGTTAAKRLYGINLYERTVNLSVSLMVAEMLKKQGVSVIMTRRKNRAVSLDRRVYIANRRRPALFVSIHANSCPNASVRGFMVLVAGNASKRSVSAARSISKQLSATGLPSCGGVRRDTRGIRVLRKTTCPAVLVEMAFLSNRRDAKLLNNSKWQKRIAKAITKGIVRFLKKNKRR